MAARGLAPRRTPGADRVARHSPTAYSATAGDTNTDSVAAWASHQPEVVHTAGKPARATLPACCRASCASLAASGYPIDVAMAKRSN